MAEGAPFNFWKISNGSRGDVWRVELDRGANVFLVDGSSFNAFKANRKFRYRGGLISRSPHGFVLPSSGTWYIVAHSWGLRQSARVSVRPLTEARALPPAAPSQVSLESIAAEAARFPDEHGHGGADKSFDVFISHASEDKDDFVRPLAHALVDQGLDVWFDEFELRIGMSLRRSIDRGLAASRFGIVVLSEDFFAKGWTNYELDGLVTRDLAAGGGQIILPIWHRVSKDAVTSYSPSLADKMALRSADSTIAEIASEIAAAVSSAG